MQRGNGAVIGKQNTPTTSVATGVWALNEVQRAVLNGTWPASTNVDPYFENVSMLLHGNGTNGAQNNTFLDSSTNNFTITRNGNTTQGTFTPYGSNWSNYFDGSGDYLTVPSNTALNLGSGDFTIEVFWYPTAFSTDDALVMMGTSAGSFCFALYNNSTGGGVIALAGTGGGSWDILGGLTVGTAVLNQWNHVVLVRSGTTFSTYMNGVRGGTQTSSSSLGSADLGIAANSTGGSMLSAGYLSNLRILKGTALYSGTTLTVPTSPLTAITNTSLLTCQSNRFIDNSTNNFTITRNGDVSVQRFSPFNPTTPYAAGTIGGSGYFDGSGYYLSAPDNAAWYFTGDFTVECWAYWSSVSSSEANVLAQHRPASAANQAIEFWSNATTLYLAYSSSNVTTTITANQWYHLAMSCSSGTASCYVNGTRIGTFVMPTRIDSADPFTVGARTGSGGTGGTGYFTGYVSDVRVVNGTGLYSGATITVPTAPLTAITNTSLLCSFTNGGIIDNAMMNDLETVGNAQISTSVSKFGGGSLAFDGSGDYLTLANVLNTNLGSGPFTIELWAYFNSASGTQFILSNYQNSTIGYGLGLSGGVISFWATGDTPDISSGLTPTTGVWYHIAVSGQSGSIKMFINGTQYGSTFTGTPALDSTATLRIGDGQGAASPQAFNGYIDDLRITKGYARYTANFTAPTLPFPDQ